MSRLHIAFKNFISLLISIFSFVGNFYSKGEVRRKELFASCKILGISEDRVKIVDHRYNIDIIYYNDIKCNAMLLYYI